MVACEENIEKINQTRENIVSVAKNPINDELNEERINHLLDKILEFKADLNEITSKINSIIKDFETITWIQDPNQEILNKINELIEVSKKFYSNSKSNFTKIDKPQYHAIAENEMKEYVNALEDFNEAMEDLEKVFFIYPNDNELNDLNAQLLLL